MNDDPASHPRPIYQIKVRGRLDPHWADWFGGLTVTHEGDLTTLTGPLPDQAALRAVLTKIWDLNLTLMAVKQVDFAAPKNKGRHSASP